MRLRRQTMTFNIFPAIDMRDGKCVRLQQGDYNKETIYGDSPFDMAKLFADEGASWIHMVDLDGARDGRRINAEHVLKVVQELDVKVQIGGGIRTEEDVAFYLGQGVDRVIIGSVAVSDPILTKTLLKKYGDRIAIGLDAREGFVATDGWLQNSEKTAIELGKEFAEAGAETFIYTDISKDGMLCGPNTEAIVELAEETGKKVIASGGIRNIEDIINLKENEQKGVTGAIVGKALYTNKFTVKEALNKVVD